MPLKRSGWELTVEVELPGADGQPPARARLSAPIEPAPGAESPSAEEIASAIAELRGRLGTAAGPGGRTGPAPDRSLGELIETYRPRQSELVELLFEEGEITAEERRRLAAHLAGGTGAPAPSAPVAAPAPSPVEPAGPAPDRPIAAAPLELERPVGPPRPVPELLERYQIHSLKQAGAVRARRQISFEEYMALKRHFTEADAPAKPATAP